MKRRGFKRSTKPLRRTPMSRVSKKRKVDSRAYQSLRKRLLGNRPPCDICGEAIATDIHHTDSRGKNLLNEDTLMVLCRRCHDLCHFGANTPIPEDDRHYEDAKAAGITHYGPKFSRHFGYLK